MLISFIVALKVRYYLILRVSKKITTDKADHRAKHTFILRRYEKTNKQKQLISWGIN